MRVINYYFFFAVLAVELIKELEEYGLKCSSTEVANNVNTNKIL